MLAVWLSKTRSMLSWQVGFLIGVSWSAVFMLALSSGLGSAPSIPTPFGSLPLAVPFVIGGYALTMYLLEKIVRPR
jgi:hypothetical protein